MTVDEPGPDFKRLGELAPPRRDRRRPDLVAEALKDWIVEQGLHTGDRLPQERDLIDAFGVAKSTIREALRGLQMQGIITTRTGPGGGAFVDEVSEDRAIELLANYFFFKPVGIADIYHLRRLLEPELAASVAGKLREADFERLEQTMTVYARAPATIEEEHEQRIAELEFHSTLVDLTPNPILGFTCRFLIMLLKNLTVCRRIYDRPNPRLRVSGRSFQLKLIKALRAGDTEAAREVMRKHMTAAQRLMEEQEAIVVRQFLKSAPEDTREKP